MNNDQLMDYKERVAVLREFFQMAQILATPQLPESLARELEMLLIREIASFVNPQIVGRPTSGYTDKL